MPRISMLRAAPITGLLVALAAGCSRSAADSTVTEPPTVLLEDDFNLENEGASKLNYTSFLNWDVIRGSVDLIGTPPYHDLVPAQYRIAVDLDGTTMHAGLLQSKATFSLSPGMYTLRFDLGGMPRDTPPNTVVVTLGDVYREQFTIGSFTPMVRYSRTIQVSSATTGKLAFDHRGGDNFGIVLDNVHLARN